MNKKRSAKVDDAYDDNALKAQALEILTAIMEADLGEFLAFDAKNGALRIDLARVKTHGRGVLIKSITTDPATGEIIGLELHCKQKAIDTLARLLGWNAPTCHEHRTKSDDAGDSKPRGNRE